MTTKTFSYYTTSLNGDTLTPITIFKRLKGTNKFLLESSFQHETKGKYSYIGSNPIKNIIGINNETIVHNLQSKTKQTYKLHTLQYMKEHFPKIKAPVPLPFSGGAIGYVAYDAIRQVTPIGEEKEDPLQMPDYHFMVYETVIVYEHRTDKVHIVSLVDHTVCESSIQKHHETIKEELNQVETIQDPKLSTLHFKPMESKEAFIQKVEQAKSYIHQGECEQIVLSQRMVAELNDDPFSIYRKLRSANPSPYMYYIDFDSYKIIGSSPESLVQTNDDTVITNPIAGTKPRGKTEEEDIAIAKKLLQDKKEITEHDMLVQLSREDLHSICKEDSIHVPVYKNIVHYEHVMHIVSETHGVLKDKVTSLDALMSCLPAGTVSGSPKKRAMQIINEIESIKRGFYAGGIGYIGFNHDINIAISIRSFIIKNQKAYVQAGAGIIKDSIPTSEYEETLHKLRSLTNLSR